MMTGDHGCTACRLGKGKVAYENDIFHESSSCQNQLDLVL